MDLVQIITLALVQGFTEFLPVSSSAHLILAPVLLGWSDQGLAFDVAVHAGTLAAVVIYFRAELMAMATAWSRSFTGGSSPDSRLAWGVVLATLPVSVAGFLGKDLVEGVFRFPVVIAASTILFGLVLWWSDRFGRKSRDEYSLTLRDAVVIGLAQMIALIPGTSRAGITITAALLLGLNRTAAARFSFLLSIPTIAAAGVLVTADLLQGVDPIDWATLFVGFAVSAVTAYLTMHFFIRLLDRTGMLPYVIYRLILGSVLLWVFW